MRFLMERSQILIFLYTMKSRKGVAHYAEWASSLRLLARCRRLIGMVMLALQHRACNPISLQEGRASKESLNFLAYRRI